MLKDRPGSLKERLGEVPLYFACYGQEFSQEIKPEGQVIVCFSLFAGQVFEYSMTFRSFFGSKDVFKLTGEDVFHGGEQLKLVFILSIEKHGICRRVLGFCQIVKHFFGIAIHYLFALSQCERTQPRVQKFPGFGGELTHHDVYNQVHRFFFR